MLLLLLELVIPVRKPTKYAKAETETDPVTVEIKISKYSIEFRTQ